MTLAETASNVYLNLKRICFQRTEASNTLKVLR